MSNTFPAYSNALWKWVAEPTFWANIYIAGDIEVAEQFCREECMNHGLCVTIEPTEYIYTGGQETGMRIGLINYPRFPSEPRRIIERAQILAEGLLVKLCQKSALIMTPVDTIWLDTGKKTS